MPTLARIALISAGVNATWTDFGPLVPLATFAASFKLASSSLKSLLSIDRPCPPEDCGGPRGYQEMLEALADASHDQHEDMKSWIGGSFDSESFDPTKVRFDDPQERWNRAFKRT